MPSKRQRSRPIKRIFIPTESTSDWQRLLAKPSLHWKKGHSAMTAAACWEGKPDSLPIDIKRLLDESGEQALFDLKVIAAFPEWKVDLDGAGNHSATDIMALARNESGLVAIAVEAKVDESFGPTLREKRKDASEEQTERIALLQKELMLANELPGSIRYQLLHRTVSALRTAKDFHARTAVMLVQCWRSEGQWRSDLAAFHNILGATSVSTNVSVVTRFESPRLYLAWSVGDPKFLEMEIPSLPQFKPGPVGEDGPIPPFVK